MRSQTRTVESQSDSSLVRQLIEGSQDALAGLYDRHAQAVFATALRVSQDRGIAAEVVQETFLTLWNRAELFDPSRGALPDLVAGDRAKPRDRSLPGCRPPRTGRHVLVVRWRRVGRSGDRRVAHVIW